MASGDEREIPDSGGVFTFGRCRFAENQPSHFFIRNDPVVQIDCGDEHTALVCQNGRVFVFGSNEHGQLGLGHTKPVTKPSCLKQLKPLVSRLISCGKGHTLVATACHKLFAFGSNSDGQLGLGDTVERHEPVEVDLSGVGEIRAISAGCLHSLLLTESGDAYAWGCNSDGQCGHKENDSILRPSRISLDTPVSAISCGYYHTALISDGDVYTMGEVDSGKLGVSSDVENFNFSPQKVDIAEKCVSVACGGNHTLTLTESGTVYVFGSNFSGQLGMQNVTVVKIPTLLSFDKKIERIACGESHSAFVTDDEELLTCGDTRHGKLCIDIASGTNLSTPTLVQILLHLQVTYISCGGCHTMVLAKTRPPTDPDVICSTTPSVLPPLVLRRQSTQQSPSISIVPTEGSLENEEVSEAETICQAPLQEEEAENQKQLSDKGDSKSNTESSIDIEEDELVVSAPPIEMDSNNKEEEFVIQQNMRNIQDTIETENKPVLTPRSRMQKLLHAFRRSKKTSKLPQDDADAIFIKSGVPGDQNASKACAIL